MIPRIMLVLFALLCASPVRAQILPPNAAGISAGHEHFRVTDVEAAERFWTALGGVIAPMGQVRVVKFPGIIVMLARATAETPVSGGTEGTTVDLIRFRVKNLNNTLAALDSAGYKPLPGSTARSASLMTLEKAKVSLVEDASLPTAVATDALIMKVPNVAEAAAWYAKWFGGKVTGEGDATFVDIPGMQMRFSRAATPVAGTRGRALDHIGFEVNNLEAFMKTMANEGVTISRPFQPAPPTVQPVVTSLGFVTDPWGTYIELNEGFSKIK